MRNIDALNANLKQFNLPDHRKVVSDSLANLDWLRKHLPKQHTVDGETNRLLQLSSKQLHEPYVPPS